MDTNTAIEIHLSKRPIARILNQSNENNDSIALRLMCIIDYYMEERHLYSRIAKTQCPKLLVQLLKFHTFVSFKYYDYRASRKVGDNVLRCKFCDLVGPYTYILTHMAINHNAHIGLKMCAYCNREELKTHFNNETFDKCYNHYLQRHVVTRDDEIFEIVASFYALIKEISEKLNVCTVRNHAYAGTGYTAIEKIAHKYGRDFPTDCIIFQQRNFEKPIRDETLQKEFVRVISFMYGGNHISRLMRKIETRTDENVIVISDDDDDDSTHDEFDSPIRSHGELRAPATVSKLSLLHFFFELIQYFSVILIVFVSHENFKRIWFSFRTIQIFISAHHIMQMKLYINQLMN